MNRSDRISRQLDARWRVLIWGAPIALLVLPAIAMRLTPEVEWTGSDFVVMGVLLAGLAATIDFIASRQWSGRVRTLGIVAALLVFLLVWALLATR